LCCLQCNDSRITLGDIVGVIGCGFAGQVIMQCAKLIGASQVMAIDPSPYKLEIAKKMGADVLLNPQKKDIREKIFAITKNKGVDVVVEAAGSENSMILATDITARNGKIVLYSWITENINLNISRWHDDGIDIITTGLVHHTVQERFVWSQKALRVIAQKQVKIDPLITKTYSLENIQEAFEEVVRESSTPIIKAIIRP